MVDFKTKREELLKTKEEFIKRADALNKEFKQISSNINAVEGALMLLDDLESHVKEDKESKATDTTTQNIEEAKVVSETKQ